MTTSSPASHPVVAAIRAEPALAAAIGASSLVAVRLMAVSGWRVDVALALLASSGPANVLLGSVFDLIPYAAPAVVIQLARAAINDYRARGRFGTYGVLAITFLGWTVLVTPVLLLGFSLLFVLIFALVRWRARRPIGIGLTRDDYWLTVAIVPVLTYMAAISTPWLPPEVIMVSGKPMVGYVASIDSRWVYVLKDSPRLMLVVEQSEVERREPCRLRPSIWTTTMPDLNRPLPLPTCP